MNTFTSAGGTIFHSLRSVLPLLDRSIHALVTDLHERGLDKEVLVLVWGEFGRTPKIVQNGRDHWPDASFALFAGAVRAGQVVGETDSKGERPKNRRQIIRMRLKPEEDLGERMVKVSVRSECFTGAIEQLDWPARKRYEEFDFGYVLTVHKAQGSQWDDVVLFDESGAFPENRDRWLYTGVTRAAKRLTVVV